MNSLALVVLKKRLVHRQSFCVVIVVNTIDGVLEYLQSAY